MFKKIFISLIILSIIIFTSCTQKSLDKKNISKSNKEQQKDSVYADSLNKAPDFTLKDLSGKEVKLSDFSGKVIILDFWATWCPPCKAEIPNFVKLYHKYKDKGFVVIGIALDRGGKADVLPFVKEKNVDYPILLGDMTVVRDYGGINAIPTTFIIDKKGNIVEKVVGYRPKEYFESKILSLLK